MVKKRLSDLESLERMVNDCDMIREHTLRLGVTRQTMLGDRTCLDAVSKRIESIGEIVYDHLSEQFKDAHPEIDWYMISGMRHRLVHAYHDTKWDIVVDVTYDEIPKLREFCLKALSD